LKLIRQIPLRFLEQRQLLRPGFSLSIERRLEHRNLSGFLRDRRRTLRFQRFPLSGKPSRLENKRNHQPDNDRQRHSATNRDPEHRLLRHHNRLSRNVTLGITNNTSLTLLHHSNQNKPPKDPGTNGPDDG